MTFSLVDIARILALPVPTVDPAITGYSIDSRTAAPGDLFFAFPGEQTDGHAYVAAAFAQGAAAAIVERFQPDISGPQLVVPDTLAALQTLATAARDRWRHPLLGITGSAGKTSTKECVATLLDSVLPTSRTTGNFNNHIGLPLSLLRIAPGARAAVLEMGMNHSGEIARLCQIARPDMGLVTNIGHAHIENFTGIEGIAAAKRELVESLPATGVAFLNADDPRVAAFASHTRARIETFGLTEAARTRATHLEFSPEGSRFVIDGQPFHSPVPGRIGVLNITAAVAVARLWGAPLRQLSEAANQIVLPKMRTERLSHQGLTIWNDCYNSNPDAARAMLEMLRDTAPGRRIAVLGEMRELGHWAEPLHRDLGRIAVESGVSVLLGIRGAARFTVESALKAGLSDRAAFFFEDPQAAGDALKSLTAPGDTILFKGSRGTRVELALERFLA